MENMKKIANGMYLIRTQAGLKKAISLEFEFLYMDWKDFRVDYAPKSYPSIISLTMGYDGGQYIQCNWVHLNEIALCLDDVAIGIIKSTPTN